MYIETNFSSIYKQMYIYELIFVAYIKKCI